jgi:histidinol-phosphate aminotransferase
MTIPFTPLVTALPASVPFVGPETLERQRGEAFVARIGANESAFGISAAAAEAMHQAINDRGCSWYADPENFELRTALAEKHGVHIEEICVDAGIDTLLGLTVRMFVQKGTAVITSLGAYPTFNYHVNGFGGALHTVPYNNNHEDPNALLAAAHKKTARLIYLSNPDNPMGTSVSSAQVAAMIDKLPENSMLLLDEAYIEFANTDLAPAIDTSNPQVIRFRTFSKAYGMAGMRIGYAIAHRDVITGFNKIRNHFGINRLAQIGALASLNDQSMLPEITQLVSAGRERIYQLAQSLDLHFLESSSNFVAVDLGTSERAGAILKSLNNAGIFIRMPGVAPLNQFIRVGVGTAHEHELFTSKFTELVRNYTN